MDEGRQNPFRGFADMMGEMNRMRDIGSHGYRSGQGVREAAWSPTADVFGRGGDLVIRLELPGVWREDVEVTLHGGVLTVSGQRRSDLDEGEVRFFARERYLGAFRRSFSLPQGVRESAVEATFDEGVLEITVRGALSATAPKAHRIPIHGRFD